MTILVAGEKVIIPFLRPRKAIGKEYDVGWINTDVTRCIENDFSDNEGEDDSNYDEIDMSGI